MRTLLISLVFLGFGLGPRARGAFTLPPGSIVVNGGFENAWTGWGWTYNIGVFAGYPSAAEGRNWGIVFGTAYQDLNTTPGLEYHLQFAMAGNFNYPGDTVMNVYWAGTEVRTLDWSPAGHDINNLGWMWCDVDLTATASTTRLLFENPAVGTQNIPYLDAVSVVVVPEPSQLVLVGAGFCYVAGRRLRRRN